MIRPTTDLEKQVLSFLNDLRDSGATNMYAAAPYIVEEFPEISVKDARRYLSLWMKNFSESGDYNEIDD